METKQQFEFMEEKRLSFNFANFHYVHPIGTSGGLALWWKNGINLSVLHSTNNYIHVFIQYNAGFYCSFVYAPSVPAIRREFWNCFRNLQGIDQPWMLAGDFNAVAFTYEKEGGNIPSAASLQPFRSMISEHSLMDQGFSGNPFTWTNRKQRDELVKCRLDRVMANTQWTTQFDNINIVHEGIIGSDHAPMTIDLAFVPNQVPALFRFDKRWNADNVCHNHLTELWTSGNTTGEALTALREALQTWSKEELANKRRKDKAIKRQIKALEGEWRTEEVIVREQALKRELQDIWRTDEDLWKQTARARWNVDGDRNTAYFHATTKFQKHRNTVIKLKTDNDGWITGRSDLAAHAKAYFEVLFQEHRTEEQTTVLQALPTIVPNSMNNQLTQRVTPAEIREAVFSLGPDQAPGPDGFQGHFYRKHWETIGDKISQEVMSFFATATMPHGWNNTHIVLIPKKPNPQAMPEFRPISCCNFNYKIIAKILANRLKPCMPDLISEMQSAFIKGRAIQDNVMIVHETLHSFKIRKTGRREDMCIKLDMRKAYDLVDWSSLTRILHQYGFSGIWTAWITECITTVRFDVLLNGQETGRFAPSRGIRQGCPLSPFLFILLSNALSIMIDQQIAASSLHGIKLSRYGPRLTHCLFADDTIIFGQATVQEASIITNTITSYGLLTGQEINREKSAIFFSRNVPMITQTNITNHFGFPAAQGPTKYLGVPTEWGRSKRETFAFLIDKIETQAQSWKCRFLSPAGKETLIKSVIQAIPAYLMSCFLLPKSISNRMNALVRRFFWSGSMKKRSIHWCNGTRLCNAKQEGGMGFKEFRDFNLALLAKQAWRLLEDPTSLWARVFKAKYFRRSSFLQAKKGPRPSWIWTSIIEARALIKIGAIKVIGNGTSFGSAEYPWIPINDGVFATDAAYGNTRPAEWIDPNTRTWNRNLLKDTFPTDTADHIASIAIGPPEMGDSWKWMPTVSGEFTVRTAYHAYRAARSPTILMEEDIKKQWTSLWRLPIPPRVRFFLWRCAANCQATTSNLHQRGCAHTSLCPLCHLDEETTTHCLFLCPEATTTWAEIRPNRFGALAAPSFLHWLLTANNHHDTTEVIIKVATIWNIWKNRNNRLFRHRPTNVTQIKQDIIRDSQEWKLLSHQRHDGNNQHPIQATSLPTGPPHPPTSTEPLPRRVLRTIYCDGSFKKGSQKAGYGIMIYNTDGKLTDGKAGTFHCNSAIAAEATAILNSIAITANDDSRTTIFSDCLSIVTALHAPKHRWPWICSAILQRIHNALAQQNHITVNFTPRTRNTVADSIAKAARRGILPPSWLQDLPTSMQQG
ncbi:LINE-1 retrotransposable element ORF2 protein [Linum grandiflorum]